MASILACLIVSEKQHLSLEPSAMQSYRRQPGCLTSPCRQAQECLDLLPPDTNDGLSVLGAQRFRALAGEHVNVALLRGRTAPTQNPHVLHNCRCRCETRSPHRTISDR